MIETRQEYSFEYFANNYSVSVTKEIVLTENNVVIGRNRVHGMAFMPGMIDQLIEYLGDPNHALVSYCNTIWTPEIIAAQNALIEQANQN